MITSKLLDEKEAASLSELLGRVSPAMSVVSDRPSI